MSASPAQSETPRLALSRRGAAAALGMSLRHFQRHVQPELRCIYSGQLRLYPVAELERWMSDQAWRNGTAAQKMCRMAGRDTKTRYQGVFARHQKYCAVTEE